VALARLLDCDTSPAVRLGAAKAVIENMINLQKFADIDNRLAELEARAALARPGGHDGHL
jgi:hypothetical protein